mmetsp:Transcript_4408/g.13360  ORF Transcript_4408/g.13360 Transcript_4408/m.13360 type:complete len:206 (+) Transcript_4408:305-922(+)
MSGVVWVPSSTNFCKSVREARYSSASSDWSILSTLNLMISVRSTSYPSPAAVLTSLGEGLNSSAPSASSTKSGRNCRTREMDSCRVRPSSSPKMGAVRAALTAWRRMPSMMASRVSDENVSGPSALNAAEIASNPGMASFALRLLKEINTFASFVGSGKRLEMITWSSAPRECPTPMTGTPEVYSAPSCSMHRSYLSRTIPRTSK